MRKIYLRIYNTLLIYVLNMKQTISTTKMKRSAPYTFRTFDEVFSKIAKEECFKQAYSEEMTRLRLAREIRMLRTKKRMTQEVVARKVGMPQSVIARVESGGCSVSVDTLGRIAYALGKQVHLA